MKWNYSTRLNIKQVNKTVMQMRYKFCIAPYLATLEYSMYCIEVAQCQLLPYCKKKWKDLLTSLTFFLFLWKKQITNWSTTAKATVTNIAPNLVKIKENFTWHQCPHFVRLLQLLYYSDLGKLKNKKGKIIIIYGSIPGTLKSLQ